MTLPIDPGPGFRRVLDVMRSEEVDYATDLSGRYTETPVEGILKEKVKKLHAELIELIAESDDSLLQTFFDQGNLTEEQLRGGVHAAIQNETFVPVFVTSANNNIGVARLMDMIAKYGSSPVDRREVPAKDESGTVAMVALQDRDAAACIWKTISEPHVGELSFCRVYAGSIRVGEELYNPERGAVTKIGQTFSLQGHERKEIHLVGPGDIAAMAKLKDCHTGNTLTSMERRVRLPADSKHRHKKQSGGSGQFAEFWLRIKPGDPGSGVQFSQSLAGDNVDRAFVPSVEKGIQQACTEGIVAGYRVTDVEIDFYDGKMHPVDSKDVAFQVAGREAFKAAFREANPYMLEPMLTVNIKVPEAFLGDVMSDISARRGKIHDVDMDGKLRVVKAEIPQVEMFRYATTLRSLTGGIGLHTEAFSHYEDLAEELEDRIIEEAKQQQEMSKA